MATLVTFGITQPFKDASLRVFCLAKKVRCQLVGEDAPQILMDPSAFMLASVSMSEAKYQLWRNDIPYAAQVTDEQDYQRYLPHTLSHSYGMCSSLAHLFPFFLYVASHDDIQMEYLCKAGLAAGTPIDPSRLPWLVYAYSLNGFVHERAMGRNINVMGYPFLDDTRAVSSLPFLALSFLFLFLHPSITYSNIVFFLKLAHYTRA